MRSPYLHCIVALVLVSQVFAQPEINFIKVNVGGPELLDIGFLADEPYFHESSSGDVQVSTGPPAEGMAWGDIYATQVYAEGGALTYRFPMPEGSFSVGLTFIEHYDFEGDAGPGKRLMNLVINDVPLDENVDVYERAGGLNMPAYLQKTDIASVDGYINITLVPVIENPMLSGIVIEGPEAASVLWKTVNGVTPPPDVPVSGDAATPTTTPPPNAPASSAPAPTLSGSGTWSNEEYTSGEPIARHEACAVMADGMLYNIGGRGMKPVSVYDPIEGVWDTRNGPPVEINHMQCLAYNNRIYVGGSWYGEFPTELEHTVMWAYDIPSDSWLQLKGLEEGRRRGGGAFVEYEGKFYLSHGAIGGHGSLATTTGFLDVYDPETNEWTILPNAPNPRDHTAGGIVNGKLCVAGGRRGSADDFWNAGVAPIDCYIFLEKRWEVRADLPEPRGGAMVGTTCQGLLMIAGGEGKTPGNQTGQAMDRVDLFDEATNSFREPTYMTSPRHGTGLGITSCSCGNIFVPSGSAGLGGGPEVSTTDVWSQDGVSRKCA